MMRKNWLHSRSWTCILWSIPFFTLWFVSNEIQTSISIFQPESYMPIVQPSVSSSLTVEKIKDNSEGLEAGEILPTIGLRSSHKPQPSSPNINWKESSTKSSPAENSGREKLEVQASSTSKEVNGKKNRATGTNEQNRLKSEAPVFWDAVQEQESRKAANQTVSNSDVVSVVSMSTKRHGELTKAETHATFNWGQENEPVDQLTVIWKHVETEYLGDRFSPSVTHNVACRGFDHMEGISSHGHVHGDVSRPEAKHLPVYWINLDASKNRRNYMEGMFQGLEKKMGPIIDPVRIAAVDKKEMKKLLKEGRFNPCVTLVEPGDGDYGFSYGKLHDKSMHSATEAATVLSHLSAVLKAYQDGHEVVLIVEDDAVISKEFLDQWKSYARDAPDDWKILQWATTTTVLLEQGTQLEDPWISWMPDHYSARAYMLNTNGMRAILDATHSVLNGQDVWRVPKGVVLADNAVYHFAGNAYTSTYEWIGFSDSHSESTIEKDRIHDRSHLESTVEEGRAHHLPSLLKFDSESLAIKMPKIRPEKILAITTIRISCVDQIQDEVNRLRVDSEVLCQFHTTCNWVVYFVLNDKSLESDSKRALETLPRNIQVNIQVKSYDVNKFAAINETILESMGWYDFVLLKDSDQRLAGLPWNTFMNRKGNAVVSGVLRQAKSESKQKALNLARRQRNQFHEAQLWKEAPSGGWATRMFEESQSFEVPFIEPYFVLLEGEFSKWFFSRILSSTHAVQPCNLDPDFMWCAAAKKFRPSRPACAIVPVVSLNDGTGQIKANETLHSRCIDTVADFYENPGYKEWRSYSRAWRRIIGGYSLYKIEARCKGFLQTGEFSLDSCQAKSSSLAKILWSDKKQSISSQQILDG